MSIQHLRIRTHGAYNKPSEYDKSQTNYNIGSEVEYNNEIYRIKEILVTESSGNYYTIAKCDAYNNCEDNTDISNLTISDIEPLNYINKTSCRSTCFTVNNNNTSIYYSNQLNKKLSSGLFTMNKKFMSQNKEINSQINNNMKYWHQSSDRLVPSISKNSICYIISIKKSSNCISFF
tara:strand:- start:602 stop:1132 length:531 start_codon:yes stop_codon:yes gene_type:complete